MGSFLNKATEKKGTSRMYKILLRWSACDEQQTDYNWPLHIMRMSGSLYYIKSIGDDNASLHCLKHRHTRRRPLERWLMTMLACLAEVLLKCSRGSSPWRWAECKGDNDSKHSKHSTHTTITHSVTSDKFIKTKTKLSHQN